MKKTLHTKNSGGYILLFSIILTSIMLSIVIGIITMSLRQRIFTQQVNQSTRSFYAADTGLECLIALDAAGYFGTLVAPATGAVEAVCNGVYSGTTGTSFSTSPTVLPGVGTVFEYDAMAGSQFLQVANPDTQNVCARARVTKYNNLGASPIIPLTIYEHKIEVWGYNVNCTVLHDHYLAIDAVLMSPQSRFLVERSLTYTYQTEE